MSDRTAVAAVAALVALAMVAPVVGTAAADDHAAHEVSIDTTTLTADSEQRVEITVTNPQSSNNMVSPVIEIPLRNGLSVAADRRSTQGGTEFVDGATVDIDGTTENRTAFVNASTFRGTDAVFVEGVQVPPDESRTYSVPLTVTGSSEVTLEADVRPLNNEAENIRESRAINPISSGTLDATLANGDADITVSGSAIDAQSAPGAIERDVPGGQSYSVSTTLSALGEDVSLDGVQIDEFETVTVEFTNPSDTAPVSPVVVGQTSSQAAVVDGSTARSTSMGTAEARTTQTVAFDLLVGSGQTAVAVGAESDLPMNGVASTQGVDSSRFAGDTSPGVVILKTDGAVDDSATVTFQGRFLGDTNGDATVDDADAATVADRLAAGQSDSLTDYADVSDDDTLSAVDAMQIQQYAEGNRTADYTATRNGGS